MNLEICLRTAGPGYHISKKGNKTSWEHGSTIKEAIEMMHKFKPETKEWKVTFLYFVKR